MDKELKLSQDEVRLLRSVLEKAVRSERGKANFAKSEPGRAHSGASVDEGAATSRKEELQRLLDRLRD